MKQNTRQRIVGTVVLLFVAVVLLPLLLDGDGEYRQPPLEPRIPDPPETPDVPETVNRRPDIEADRTVSPEPPSPSARTADAPDTDDTQTADSDTPAEPDDEPPATAQDGDTADVADSGEPSLDSEGLPRGWSVRLGVFSSPENVSNLVERLREDDYAAYTRNVSRDGDSLTAVLVGPKVEREEADNLQQELQQAFQLEGRVERYSVEDL